MAKSFGMPGIFQFICLAILLSLAQAGDKPLPGVNVVVRGPRAHCPACDPSKCPIAKGCLAGVVKDRCGCCYVCGLSEGEKCKIGGDNREEFCGEKLICKKRKDIEDKLYETTCQCKEQVAVCGVNGVTYDNICKLRAEAARTGRRIDVRAKHPCNTAPTIRSAPEDAKNYTGSYVVLACEASGYPLPKLEWTWTNVEHETYQLPSDDLRISINSRGGPEKYMVTGWVQIMDLQDQHQGDYTCVVRNEVGEAAAKARVNVFNPSRF